VAVIKGDEHSAIARMCYHFVGQSISSCAENELGEMGIFNGGMVEVHHMEMFEQRRMIEPGHKVVQIITTT